MATLQDILSGNFPAAQRYAEGYAQMPSYLQDPYLGLSTSNIGKVTKGLLGNEKVLYHVTSPKNVPKILKEGIKPNAGKGFTKGQLGQTLSEKDTVYAFDNYNDALRWQTKMNYDATDPKKASQIVPFVDDISKYTPDTHPEYNDLLVL